MAQHRYALCGLLLAALISCEAPRPEAQPPAHEPAPAPGLDHAQAPAPPSLPVTTFYSVEVLTQPDDLQKQVRGARAAVLDEWPASLFAKSSAGICSATLVGPNTVLTAAHCVFDAGVIAFELKGIRHLATCAHAPEYRTDRTADYALCEVTPAVASVRFERVNADPALLDTATELLLTGFGCVGLDDQSSGVYMLGDAPIFERPGPDKNYITTGGEKNEVALCFGDSGGAAFHVDGRGKRIQVAVNSAIDANYDPLRRNLSLLSSTSSGDALMFFRTWSEIHGTKICGLDNTAMGCR